MLTALNTADLTSLPSVIALNFDLSAVLSFLGNLFSGTPFTT